ncbi:MAG TPA: Na(+)/H(+) antiporter subunit B [Candidatus Altiarchaeales archaeon]|nr:Na(+)/H(+) antiporter subunit B [Candidatus Altiarchaeales archaeon]
MSEKEVESIVARTITRIVIPFIQIFGIYVIFHGETSPGGGFQGGVILGTSMILYGVVFSLRATKKKVPKKILVVFMSIGLLIYSGIGLLDMVSGGKYLEYTSLPLPIPHHELSSISILSVEIGIGLTVMSVIILLFIYLAGEKSGTGLDTW